nr:lymphocyte antigen 6 complex locus protein G5b-like isoform X1 [Chrysemys picta bellii]
MVVGGVFVPISHCISPCSPPAGSNLRCRQCALNEPYIGCLPGVSECTPKAGHPCMTVNIGYRGEVQFLLQGCIMNPSRCGMVKELMVPEYHINITCCSHASFCNEWVPLPPGKGGH